MVECVNSERLGRRCATWLAVLVFTSGSWTSRAAAEQQTALASSVLALAFSAAEAEPTAVAVHSYELDYRSDNVALTAHVYPRDAAGARLKVLSEELLADADADALERVRADLETAAERGFWCSQLLRSVPSDARQIRSSEESVVYEFDPQPTGDRNDSFVANLVGEISINPHSGAVQRFRLSAPKPFRQALVAKIKEFDLTTHCSPGPDGRYFASDFVMSIRGSAAFREFSDDVRRTLKILPEGS